MKVMLDPGAIMPQRAHPQDAGLDLFSREEQIILPGESAVFDTGVHIELPEGTFLKLESKSGLNVKYGVVSHGGVIDQNYRGSIAVKLYNHGDKPYMIKKGQKIIQGIIQQYLAPELELAESLSETDRGSNGFGSTEEMWKSEPKKADFIRDDEDLQTILICAVRYALGRATYMPGLVTRWIEGNCIDKLSKKTIGVMIRDIDEARGRNGLGMACDVEVWLRFYEWLKKEEQKQWAKSASLLR